MLEVLVWLARVEASLAASLSKVKFSGSPDVLRLRRLSRGKRLYAREALTAASKIRRSPRRPPKLSGLCGLMEDVDVSLTFLASAIASGLRGQELADSLAAHELLKWNNLVLAIGSQVKENFPESVRFLVSAQRHKRLLESFLGEYVSPGSLFALRVADPVWRERLLFIGEFAPELKSAVRRDCVVEEASGGDAIEMLRQRYYGAVVADGDLTGLKSSELLRKAAKSFPGIEERILFLYGHERKGKSALKTPRRLHKSAPPARILEEVGMILDR